MGLEAVEIVVWVEAVKNWYWALYKALMELVFTRCEADHGVFFKEVGDHIIISWSMLMMGWLLEATSNSLRSSKRI